MSDPLDIACPTCLACGTPVRADQHDACDDCTPMLEADAKSPAPLGDLRLTSPSGVCAVCARAVTGSRRLCGACAVRRAS
jgi:hypothetical protein